MVEPGIALCATDLLARPKGRSWPGGSCWRWRSSSGGRPPRRPFILAGYGAAWFARWGRNFGFFVLNGGPVDPVRPAGHHLGGAACAVEPGGADGAAVPLWAWLPLDILLLDLWIYWWHRANHEWPFLWRFHEVHHRDRHLDATTALRFHFGEVALSARGAGRDDHGVRHPADLGGACSRSW